VVIKGLLGDTSDEPEDYLRISILFCRTTQIPDPLAKCGKIRRLGTIDKGLGTHRYCRKRRTMMKRALLILVIVALAVPVVLYVAFPGAVVEFLVDLERKSCGLSKGSVAIGDHTVYYLKGGEGETILLVHGFGANKDNWNQLAKYLTPSYHVVAVDLPGFGESTKRQEASYTIAAQVERLDKIAEALSLKSFHVAGNSMGGNISGKYAARFPEKVLSLGLFNSGGVPKCPETSELSKLLEKGENPLLVETPEDFDKMIEFAFVKPPWFPGIVKKALAKEWTQSKSFNEKVFREISAEVSSLEADLLKIQTRTLILWGDTDRLIDVSCTKVLEKGLQNSATVIMKDCGHVPMMERPEETSRHYLGFLQAGS
jgi:pimeloyl-ACP methyl ester carboxylesterase